MPFLYVSGMIFAILGWGCGIAWFCNLISHAWMWARTGVWPEFTIYQLISGAGLNLPHTQMIGIQNVIDWIVGQSATVALFMLMIIFGWIATLMQEEFNRIDREKKNRLRG